VLIGHEHVEGLVGHSSHAAIDGLAVLGARGFEGRFDEPGADLHERFGPAGVGGPFGKVVGVGPLQEPGGGAPVGAGGPQHELMRVDGGGVQGELQLVVEMLVKLGGALDGAKRDADDLGGFFDRGALGNVIDELTALGRGEFAGAAGVVGHGGAPMGEVSSCEFWEGRSRELASSGMKNGERRR
jgi:hypothetical protein